MKIEVVYATPALQKLVLVELPLASCARQAALASGLDEFFPQLDLRTVPLGIYGETVKDDKIVQPGDRVELYRELLVDPMQARRQRAQSTR